MPEKPEPPARMESPVLICPTVPRAAQTATTVAPASAGWRVGTTSALFGRESPGNHPGPPGPRGDHPCRRHSGVVGENPPAMPLGDGFLGVSTG